jgi:hypothetical protein
MIPIYFIIYIFSHGLVSLSINANSDSFYVEVASKIVSLVHTFYICFFSYSYLLNYISLEFFLSKLYYTRSFLIFDLLLVSYFKKYFTDYLFIFFHHVSFLLCMLISSNTQLIAQGLIAETTNFFLYTTWFLHKKKMNKGIFFKLCSILLYVSFFIFRILNFGHLLYTGITNISSFHYFEILSMVVIYILNLNWFRLLTVKLFQILRNKHLEKVKKLE